MSALRSVASADMNKWSSATSVVNGYTDYGLQMANYRGQLIGIMTQTVQYPNQLFATKYFGSTGWKRSFVSVPSKYRAAGRVAVTTLDDRFYIFYRGTNNGPYLISTTNFTDWADAGRIGSQFAETHAAPAMASFGGKLVLVGVGKNKKVYFTIVDGEGNRDISWTVIPGLSTESTPALAVLKGSLYLFHTGGDNKAFYIQKFDASNKAFGSVTKVAHNITSGVSVAATKFDNLVVAWRGKDEDIKYLTYDGSNVGAKKYVPNVYMRYQVGVATWGGDVIISYAAKNANSLSYRAPKFMDEKALFRENVSEDEEWDCKWDENKQPQKNWVRKMLCL